MMPADDWENCENCQEMEISTYWMNDQKNWLKNLTSAHRKTFCLDLYKICAHKCDQDTRQINQSERTKKTEF